MIDYDKLKLAHELALKIDYAFSHKFVLERFNNNNLHQVFELWGENYSNIYSHNVDDVISKLQELTGELKHKYQAGDEVWLIDDSEICTAIIDKYDNEEYLLRHCAQIDSGMNTGKGWTAKDKLYPSREALIEAQIDYWQSLRKFECPKCNLPWSSCQCKLECEHESDGTAFIISNKPFRCIKCGKRIHWTEFKNE
jgi:hypothetical protein